MLYYRIFVLLSAYRVQGFYCSTDSHMIGHATHYYNTCIICNAGIMVGRCLVPE